MKRILSTLGQKWPEYILEILVIIVGIYGAFAVDNWKEERERKEFEKESLEQTLVNLRSDKKVLLKIEQSCADAIISAEKILKSDVSEDSIKYWLADIIQFSRFQPLTNSYEVLKTQGLDKLSDKKLSFLLGRYYDDGAQRTIKALWDIENSFNVEWLPILRENIEDFQFGKVVILSDKEVVLTGSGRNLLILNKDNYQAGRQRVKDGLEVLNELIALIENNLGKPKSEPPNN